jgi:hypothetical protein
MLVLGVHADPADHSVWCATYPGGKNRSEIVHFDEHGQPLERYTPPGTGPHALNDLVLRDTREGWSPAMAPGYSTLIALRQSCP